MGFIFALIALISWGFGDFFIQKTTKVIGVWKALFFIGFVGAVALFPFVKNEISDLTVPDLILLSILGCVVIFGASFVFEGLREGKLAIIEPILGLELLVTVGLSMLLAGERLSLLQLILVSVVLIGIVLAVTVHHTHLHYHKRIFEKGVIMAGIGASGMALMNVLVGISSQKISPLMTNWFISVFLVAVCGAYFIIKGNFGTLATDLRKYPKAIIGQSVFDNAAWVAFAFSTTLIPISIATTVSESYITLAVLLGLFVNKEKLRYHQIVGVVLVIVSVVILSSIS